MISITIGKSDNKLRYVKYFDYEKVIYFYTNNLISKRKGLYSSKILNKLIDLWYRSQKNIVFVTTHIHFILEIEHEVK